MHSQDTAETTPVCSSNINKDNSSNNNNNNNDCSVESVPLASVDASHVACNLEGDLKSKLKLDLQSKRRTSTYDGKNFHIGDVQITCTRDPSTTTTDDDYDDDDYESRGVDDEEYDDDDLTNGSLFLEVDEYEVQRKEECEIHSCLSTVVVSKKDSVSTRESPCEVSSGVVASPMRRCSTLRKSFNQLIAKTAKILLPYHHHRHRSFHRHSAKCYTCSCKLAPHIAKETMSCNLESSTLPFICTPSDTLGVKKMLPMTRVFSDGHFNETLADDYVAVMKTPSDIPSPLSSSASPTFSEKTHQSIKYCTTVTGNEHKRLLELPDRFDTRLRRKSDSFLLRAKSPVTSDILDSPATCTSCSCSSSTSYFLLTSPKLVDGNTFSMHFRRRAYFSSLHCHPSSSY